MTSVRSWLYKYQWILVDLVILIFLLLLWQVIENNLSIHYMASGQTSLEAFIPTPATIIHSLIIQRKLLLFETWITIQRALCGLIIGSSFAVISAIVFIYSPYIKRFFYPVSVAINSFPLIGFTPAIILLFGQGSWLSIVTISAILCYFPTLIHVNEAFTNIDSQVLDVFRILNASKWQELIKARIPLALPAFFISMRLAIPASIIGATMGEWLGTRHGIGQLITIALYQLNPGLMYAAFFIVASISIVGVLIIILLEHKILFWHKNDLDP